MKRFTIVTALGISALSIFSASAENITVPHSINYQGVIYDSSERPIYTPLDFRFSLWSDADFQTTQILDNGEINTATNSFSGYQETQTLIPDNNGSFHTAIGEITALPQLQSNIHAFLQVEVKPQGAANTEYEVLDTDDDINNTTDRRALNSSAYAINADNIDNRSVGLEAGNIAPLNNEGKLDTSIVPNKTNEASFILNADNSEESAVRIFFNSALEKALSWINNRFELSDSLFISGNLANSGSSFLGDDETDTTSISGALNLSGTLNGRNLANDAAKLDTIETHATADQTASEVPFTSTSFQATNVEDALLGLKTITNTQAQQLEEETAQRIALGESLNTSLQNSITALQSDTTTQDAINTKIQALEQKTFSAADITVSSDEILSDNVQDAIIGLKKIFEGIQNEQAEQIVRLEQQIAELSAELNNYVNEPVINTERQTYSWNYIPSATAQYKSNNNNLILNKGHTMTQSGTLSSLSVFTTLRHSKIDETFMITKNDNGAYSEDKEMTRIEQTKDNKDSLISYTLRPSKAGLAFQAGDILRIYQNGKNGVIAQATIEIEIIK